MNATTGTEVSQSLQRRAKTEANKWSKIFRRRRMNDPLLVFNMAIFNVDDGWSRVFDPMKIHENGV
jgi:hypothetical protein